jgi:hypothetical protein
MVVPNRLIEQIFRPVGGLKQTTKTITKGSLITFNYMYWKNDAYPLVFVSKYLPGNKIYGINLHYLTFNYIKNLLRNCNSPAFSYQTIKNDTYLKSAYRSYKWSGIRLIKSLDCTVLLNIMGTIRSFDPAEVEIIRKNVQDQLSQQINPKTYEVNINTNKQAIPKGIVPIAKTIQTVPTVPTQIESE